MGDYQRRNARHERNVRTFDLLRVTTHDSVERLCIVGREVGREEHVVI